MKLLREITQLQEIQRWSNSQWENEDSLNGMGELIDVVGFKSIKYSIQKLDNSPFYWCAYDYPDGIDTKVINIFSEMPTEKNYEAVSIGEIQLEPKKHFPLKNAYTSKVVIVKPAFRSKGVGRALYKLAANALNITIVADDQQTEDGRRIWVKMAKESGITVQGYFAIDDSKFSVSDEDGWGDRRTARDVDETIDEIMGKLGGQYIDKVRDIHYFAFDIDENAIFQELKSAVKTKLTKSLYTNSEIGDALLYDIGLFIKKD